MYRNALTEMENATLTSSYHLVQTYWRLNYQMISYANTILNRYETALHNGANKEKLMQYVGEAHFYRAVAYGRLLCKYGDVPYVTSEISIDEALNKTRDSKEVVLEHAYEDFDKAIAELRNTEATC